MLLEFKVKNYKSFEKEYSLNLIKSKNSGLENNSFEIITTNKKKVELLKSSVIYGPNASGKSSLIEAIMTMKKIVTAKPQDNDEDEVIPVIPFKLNQKTIAEPSVFEVTFIQENIHYQYGFSATNTQIFDEWLIAFPLGRPQLWFSRQLNDKKTAYDWKLGNSLKGQKEIWKEMTRKDMLYLSTAANLKSSQLEKIKNWFKNTLKPTSSSAWGTGFTVFFAHEDKKNKEKVLDFLRNADIDLSDILIEEKKMNLNDFPKIPKKIKEKIIGATKGKKLILHMTHKTNQNELINFKLNEESDGTQRLFDLAGPLIDSLEKGNVVVIDELNLHLHPHLVKFIVELFHNPKINKGNAQLIFTTHDTSILNQSIFRNDQVWFCEKNQNQATELYSLSDFKIRKKFENLEKNYLHGRYGAIPNL